MRPLAGTLGLSGALGLSGEVHVDGGQDTRAGSTWHLPWPPALCYVAGVPACHCAQRAGWLPRPPLSHVGARAPGHCAGMEPPTAPGGEINTLARMHLLDSLVAPEARVPFPIPVSWLDIPLQPSWPLLLFPVQQQAPRGSRLQDNSLG